MRNIPRVGDGGGEGLESGVVVGGMESGGSGSGGLESGGLGSGGLRSGVLESESWSRGVVV